MSEKKVVLAYSGGLDTSVILRDLLDRGYDVVAFIADVGQDEDFEEARRRAEAIGAVEIVVEDLKERFVRDFVYPAIAGNAVYENRYLLGTALARPVIAAGQVEVARRTGATALSHGATGKGNDQVRFELGYAALAPELEVLSPWKERDFLARFAGRADLIRYAEDKGIPITATAEKPYSMDDNLLHKSYEAGQLEDPDFTPAEEMFDRTVSPAAAPDRAARLEIHFERGIPVAWTELDAETEEAGRRHEGALPLFLELNALAGRHGVGRIDMVENRFVGIKSRGVYETPAGTVLHAALRDLEGLVLDREVLDLRDTLALRFARLIYNGFWFSPEMTVLRAALDAAREPATGTVRVELFKGAVRVLGRRSERALYDPRQSSMDEEGGYDQTDARGFIRLHGLRLRNWVRAQG